MILFLFDGLLISLCSIFTYFKEIFILLFAFAEIYFCKLCFIIIKIFLPLSLLLFSFFSSASALEKTSRFSFLHKDLIYKNSPLHPLSVITSIGLIKWNKECYIRGKYFFYKKSSCKNYAEDEFYRYLGSYNDFHVVEVGNLFWNELKILKIKKRLLRKNLILQQNIVGGDDNFRQGSLQHSKDIQIRKIFVNRIIEVESLKENILKYRVYVTPEHFMREVSKEGALDGLEFNALDEHYCNISLCFKVDLSYLNNFSDIELDKDLCGVSFKNSYYSNTYPDSCKKLIEKNKNHPVSIIFDFIKEKKDLGILEMTLEEAGLFSQEIINRMRKFQKNNNFTDK